MLPQQCKSLISNECRRVETTFLEATCLLSCVSHTDLPSPDGLQELQHPIFSPLLARSSLLEDLTVRESLCFHFQVDLGVDIGCVDRDVPKPIADRIDVDSRFQQMHSRGMSNRVRTDPFARKRWSRFTRFRYMPPDQREDSETGNRLPTAVQEETFMGSTPGNQWRQGVYCKRPQRAHAHLPPFSQESDARRGIVHAKTVDRETGNFVSAGTRVVHEEQQSVVPSSLIGVPIWRAQQGIRFLLGHVLSLRQLGLLERNTPDIVTPDEVLGIVAAYEARPGTNGSQSLVARSYRASPLLFQVLQEELEPLFGDVLESQGVDWASALITDEGKQQMKGIAIALLGVLGEVPLPEDVVFQEAAHPLVDQFSVSRHGSPPLTHSVRSAGWPPKEVQDPRSGIAEYV